MLSTQANDHLLVLGFFSQLEPQLKLKLTLERAPKNCLHEGSG